MPTDGRPVTPDILVRLQKAALILVWMLIAAGALAALALIRPVVAWLISTFSPFLIALVIAYVFNPIVNVVQKRFKLGRLGGILVVAGIIVAILLLFFAILVPILCDQAIGIVQELKIRAPQWGGWLADRIGGKSEAEYQERIRAWFEGLDLDLRKVIQKISPMVSDIASGSVNAIQGAAAGLGVLFSSVTGFVAALVLILVITFYYLLDFDAIPRLIRQCLPSRIKGRTMEILSKIDATLAGFLRGQMIVCTLIAIIASVGLALIGMWRYAIFVGVLAGAANVIPYLGPIVGATPAVLWALLSPAHPTWTSRLVYTGLTIGLFAAIQTLDGLVFQPRIVGRNSNLHPLLVIAALVVGAQFGLSGMILAVPIACIARVLFLELVWARRPKGTAPIEN